MLGIRGRLLSATYYAPINDTYTSKGTAEITHADTGQKWRKLTTTTYSPTNPCRLSVIDGKLTNTIDEAANRAGYIYADIGAPVLKIGGSWVFGAGTGATHTGSACFIIWRKPFWDIGDIPDSPCHFVITDAMWYYGIIDNDGTLDNVATGSFDTALTCDDTTVYSAYVEIAGTKATIHLPDGTTQEVTDARIASLAGHYACFEVCQQDASTDPKAKFTNVYADITV